MIDTFNFLTQMTGSLHIHNFYIGRLKAKQEQLFESYLTCMHYGRPTAIPCGERPQTE